MGVDSEAQQYSGFSFSKKVEVDEMEAGGDNLGAERPT